MLDRKRTSHRGKEIHPETNSLSKETRKYWHHIRKDKIALEQIWEKRTSQTQRKKNSEAFLHDLNQITLISRNLATNLWIWCINRDLNTDLPPNIAKESQNRKRVSQIRPNSMLSKTYSPKQTDCIFRNQNHQQNELTSWNLNITACIWEAKSFQH